MSLAFDVTSTSPVVSTTILLPFWSSTILCLPSPVAIVMTSSLSSNSSRCPLRETIVRLITLPPSTGFDGQLVLAVVQPADDVRHAAGRRGRTRRAPRRRPPAARRAPRSLPAPGIATRAQCDSDLSPSHGKRDLHPAELVGIVDVADDRGDHAAETVVIGSARSRGRGRASCASGGH